MPTRKLIRSITFTAVEWLALVNSIPSWSGVTLDQITSVTLNPADKSLTIERISQADP